jgi:thiamine biosynthesis protein ThiS
MKILVNGETVSVEPGAVLASLVRDRGLEGRPIAVELNASIVPRERLAETSLSEGDAVEIVTFVGGG